MSSYDNGAIPLEEISLSRTVRNLINESRNLRTQKAKGLVESTKLLGGWYRRQQVTMLPDYGFFVVIKNESDIDRLMAWGGFDSLLGHTGTGKLFARPCPTTPKHGFVESRAVYCEDDLRDAWNETIEADPNGEMILCEQVKAVANAVLTPNSITLGKGHNGATSGKGAVVLPVMGETVPKKAIFYDENGERQVSEPNWKAFGVNDTPYVELVYKRNDDGYNLATCIMTQLRDGPFIEGLHDIVPVDTVVVDIIEVDPTLIENPKALLEWDQLITSLEGKQGVVVYHAGGSPTSHFGVHCAIHKVPYVVTFKPVVGELIKQTQKAKLDYAMVREGLILGLSKDYSDTLGSNVGKNQYLSMLCSALYCLHGIPVLGATESKFLGFAIANLIRLATGACLGELRHFKPIANREGKKHRSEVYAKYIADIEQGLAKLRFAHEIFSEGQWGDSFGGKNWANCTELTIQLVNAVLRFYHRSKDRNLDLPGVETAVEKLFQAVQKTFNELINAVHNGGLFLNKFGSNNMFDTAKDNLAMFAAMSGFELMTQYNFVNSFEPASKKLIREKLISSKLYRKEKRIAEALIRDVICNNCGESESSCGCEQCYECGSYSCTCRAEQEQAIMFALVNNANPSD